MAYLLNELLYAKCISAAEYNSTKSPLVQRIAAFGVAVDCPDADVGDGVAAAASVAPTSSLSVEEWSEIGGTCIIPIWDQQIESISTRLPGDKSDLNTFIPKY
uniref:Uncharacterized protein n=1 Tax=Oryza meridionalis TaxID=40149 RepID=A0A0E0F403_9ORYZ